MPRPARGVGRYLLLPVLVFALGTGLTQQVSSRAALEGAQTELIRVAGEQEALLTARLEQIGGLVAGASAHYSRIDHVPAAVSGQELQDYISAAGDGENFASLTTGLVYILQTTSGRLADDVAARQRSLPDFEIGELPDRPQHALVWAQSGSAFESGNDWNADERELGQAMERDQLSVAFQPLVAADGLAVIGMEALVRWTHQGDFRSPGMFLPIAEQSDLIVDLDLWVLPRACQMAGSPGMPARVSVNLGARTLALPDLVQRVCKAIQAAEISSLQLCLELTETSLIGVSDVMDASLQTFSDMGVSLALDDFGTGYSSLNYLRRFPVDVVKIDRSFLDGMADNQDDRAIVAGAIRLARSLGMLTVPEGVETANQRDMLIEMECDRLQGYFFGRPMFAEEWDTSPVSSNAAASAL